MASGTLVPDAMILRLIVNELTTRGWLKARSVFPFTLNASSHADSSANDSEGAPSGNYEPCDTPTASYILDGFPRTAGQATQLDNLVPVNLVVHLDTPASIIIDRIANRWVHAPSGRVYNTTFNPPKVPGKDDFTGEPLTQREDDSEATWKARLSKFQETSLPLLEHYDKQGVLWTVRGNSSDEISPQLFEEFVKRFGQPPAV